jgi:hypothetical protein
MTRSHQQTLKAKSKAAREMANLKLLDFGRELRLAARERGDALAEQRHRVLKHLGVCTESTKRKQTAALDKTSLQGMRRPDDHLAVDSERTEPAKCSQSNNGHKKTPRRKGAPVWFCSRSRSSTAASDKNTGHQFEKEPPAQAANAQRHTTDNKQRAMGAETKPGTDSSADTKMAQRELQREDPAQPQQEAHSCMRRTPRASS